MALVFSRNPHHFSVVCDVLETHFGFEIEVTDSTEEALRFCDDDPNCLMIIDELDLLEDFLLKLEYSPPRIIALGKPESIEYVSLWLELPLVQEEVNKKLIKFIKG